MKAIAAVPSPMIVTVNRNAYLRPTRSPIRPKTMAPKGRTANPLAYVARNARKLTAGSEVSLKNNGVKMKPKVTKM